ncbi:MAG: NusG domain II-containing protein [Clostridia bacterium]|nr:NusG domain II-containing protein [Clostridia bacterium]
MMKQKNVNKRHLRNDILLIIVLLLVAATGAAYLFLFRGFGDVVKVTVDGELYGVYSLSQDRTEDISTGEDGRQLNRLVIREGKAFIQTATCPDGICAAHRAIFRNGESIVCLPHGVVVTVTTAQTQGEPDVVV